MKTAYAGEQKAELQGELFATFQSCDTNGTGLLNEAQLIDFYKKAHANHVARGWTALEIEEEETDEDEDIDESISSSIV